MDAERERRSDPESSEGAVSRMAGKASDAASLPGATAVAVVIPARNEASRIALTVLAARRLPGVDLVVVADDGSTDSTVRVAEESGATVVRLEPSKGRSQGRTAALVAGIALVTARESVRMAEYPPRHLLFLDADLQQSAAEAVRLLEPVLAGNADVVLAGPEPGTGRGAAGGTSRRASRAVERATGVSFARPTAAELCLTRAALSAAEPLADGAGAGPGLIIDLVRQGFRVVEVPVPWTHRPGRRGLRARLRELTRRRELRRALASR